MQLKQRQKDMHNSSLYSNLIVIVLLSSNSTVSISCGFVVGLHSTRYPTNPQQIGTVEYGL